MDKMDLGGKVRTLVVKANEKVRPAAWPRPLRLMRMVRSRCPLAHITIITIITKAHLHAPCDIYGYMRLRAYMYTCMVHVQGGSLLDLSNGLVCRDWSWVLYYNLLDGLVALGCIML